MIELTSTKYLPHSFNFTEVCEVPELCIRMTKVLAEQPLFDGNGSYLKKSKVICMADFADARICEIFNHNAIRTLNRESTYNIYCFGCGDNQLSDSSDCLIPQGLELYIDNESLACSFDPLLESYNQVFASITDNWVASKIEDNKNIFQKEDPNDFALFVKEKSLNEEAVLIRSLTIKLSLEKEVRCCSEWITPSGYCLSDKIYMWIKKSAFKEVAEKFGFNL